MMAQDTTGSRYGFETTTGLTIQQGFFEESEEPKHNIGTCVELADGRCFHYSKAGAGALSAGNLNMAALAIGGHENCDVAVAVAVQDKQVTLTPATVAVTKDQYAEGYVQTRSAGGMGQMRKIRSHPAAIIAANVVVTCYDPFTIALDAVAPSFANLIKSPYDEVIESAVEENIPSGVPLIDVQANYFFWNQTMGPAAVLSNGAIDEGTIVVAGAVAGSVAVQSVYTMPIVGTCMLLTVDAEYGAFFLRLGK
jgi:hypothetical protein